MDLLPIFLDIRDQPCLVVGGGAVAARKVASLGRAHARIHLVAPELTPELRAQADAGDLIHRNRDFKDKDIKGMRLIIAATSDRETNQRVARLAKEIGIPVNVVDQPEECSFLLPSVIDRSPVVVAVSTTKASPVLARLLRTRLESMIPAG